MAAMDRDAFAGAGATLVTVSWKDCARLDRPGYNPGLRWTGFGQLLRAICGDRLRTIRSVDGSR